MKYDLFLLFISSQNWRNLLQSNSKHNLLIHRCLSTGNVNLGDISDSWLSKLLVRKIEPTKESHSRMLSDKEIIYSLHTDNIRPSATKEYYANLYNL